MTDPSRREITLSWVGALLVYPIWDWFFRPVGGGLDVSGYLIGRDFLPMWAAPRLAWARGPALLTDMPAFAAALRDLVGLPQIFGVWSYPPTALLLFAPASLPSYWTALALWTVAGWLAYLGSAMALRRGRPRGTELLLLALSPAAWLNMGTGQNGAFTAALLAGGFAVLDRRPLLAGALFGLMTFKPHIGIALAVALVALGAWRAIAAACLTAMALALCATLMVGTEAWVRYETVSVPYSAWVLAQSHGGQKLLLVSLTSALTQAGVAMGPALAMQAATAAVILVVLWLAVRRTPDALGRLALVAAATPLVSPYIWTYDLVGLGAALALRFTAAPSGGQRWLCAIGYLSPALFVLFETGAGASAAPPVLAAVFAGLSWQALRRSGPSIRPAVTTDRHPVAS